METTLQASIINNTYKKDLTDLYFENHSRYLETIKDYKYDEWKYEVLDEFFYESSAKEFYRTIFPKGTLQETTNTEDGKGNIIAVAIEDKYGTEFSERIIINDDLSKIEYLESKEEFCITSPISYFGRTRTSTNAHSIHALAIDLDGIDKPENLLNLLYRLLYVDYYGIVTPTYLVYSGNGYHLYYVFEEPIPAFKENIKYLNERKEYLIECLWSKGITEMYDRPQYQSLFQGFRMVGTVTKNKDKVRAFKIGNKVEYKDLTNRDEFRDRLVEIQKKLYNQSSLSLKEAKELYPEWYDFKVLKKGKKNYWSVNRNLYDWWKRKILPETFIKQGHRYFTIMCLAIYGSKCDIPYEEVEADAMKLAKTEQFNNENHTEPFTSEDVITALSAYAEQYKTFPIDTITALTTIQIEKNKRNYRKQDVHLKRIRALRDIDYPNGEWRSMKSKEESIKKFIKDNPTLSVIEIAKELNVSRPTIYKYMDKKLISKEEIIKNYIKEHPTLSVTEIAKELNVSRPTIYKYKNNTH